MRTAAIVAIASLAIGCSKAQTARIVTFGDRKVTLYSGGQAVRVWHTDGAVRSEEKSDGYFFVDKPTGLPVEISGDVVIEVEGKP